MYLESDVVIKEIVSGAILMLAFVFTAYLNPSNSTENFVLGSILYTYAAHCVFAFINKKTIYCYRPLKILRYGVSDNEDVGRVLMFIGGLFFAITILVGFIKAG